MKNRIHTRCDTEAVFIPQNHRLAIDFHPRLAELAVNISINPVGKNDHATNATFQKEPVFIGDDVKTQLLNLEKGTVIKLDSPTRHGL
ncbi:MAG: hypothetical protein Q9198_003327, partial [Flavoplaca austrocitrina]